MRLSALKSHQSQDTPLSTNTPQSMLIKDEDNSYSDDECESSDSDDDSDDIDNNTNNYIDYYCGMNSYNDNIPPNYGWDTTANGIWPAPGITIYNIDISEQDLQSPIIEKVIARTGSTKIYFNCDETKVFKIFKHLKYWFEIEAIGHEQVIKCSKSPAVVNKLINGDSYQFIVKLCNQSQNM